MSRIEKTITVDASIDTVYGQWTQFESFPTFMEGVDTVVQVDDRTLDWTASVARPDARPGGRASPTRPRPSASPGRASTAPRTMAP